MLEAAWKQQSAPRPTVFDYSKIEAAAVDYAAGKSAFSLTNVCKAVRNAVPELTDKREGEPLQTTDCIIGCLRRLGFTLHGSTFKNGS